jgi:uncharacterized membrane protein
MRALVNYFLRGLVVVAPLAFTAYVCWRLLYASTKDLLNAFVGEQRRFDRPVVVTVYPEVQGRALGFVTQSSLEHLGLAGQVAVYFPFSYSVAGHVMIFPADRVQPLPAESADVMAFLVSGGVTRLSATTPGIARRAVAPSGR